jgi:hypothetical protein
MDSISSGLSFVSIYVQRSNEGAIMPRGRPKNAEDIAAAKAAKPQKGNGNGANLAPSKGLIRRKRQARGWF